MPEGGSGLGVLDKAMALLNIVSGARGPLTFTQLLHASGLPRATLHRILGTLVREGLLRLDAYSRTYRLGFRLLELAHEVWSDFDLRLAAQDALVRLRDQVGESVLLVVPDGPSAVVVAGEEGARGAVPVARAGTRLPLERGAAGQALLAWRLQAGDELDLARSRGYAVEVSEGQVSVAAPVFDYEGRPIAAVAVVGTDARLPAQRAHGLSAALIACAREITHSAAGQAMSLHPPAAPPGPLPAQVRCVAEVPSLLGEGPLWSPRDDALYWVDILTPSLHCWRTGEGDAETKLGTMSSVAVPRAGGGLLLATPGGLVGFDPGTQALSPIAHPEAGRRGNRYNDGKCDRRGRLWIASMDMGTAAHRGSLFRVDADGRWQKMDEGFTVPNGLAWSPDDRRLYFTDTWRRTIYAYDFDLRTGTIANRRDFITFDERDGKPDGLTVDEEGCLWVALWDGWQLARVSPDGRIVDRIRLPVPRPTSCCFGGADLRTLYVTSASVRLSEQELAAAPLSGSLFALEPGVRGLPEPMFAG
ncbi:MAG TPA: SMP-30/gluconolactonase/LRE family protein [Ramlibacter sp.]|nr:SMP-30/gluconolactonase/LRE family protein [Ramlibacter sp.]